MTSDPIKVTVSDPKTGEVIEEKILSDDYCIIVAGARYVKSVRAMGRPGRATHIIAVAYAPPRTDLQDGRNVMGQTEAEFWADVDRQEIDADEHAPPPTTERGP